MRYFLTLKTIMSDSKSRYYFSPTITLLKPESISIPAHSQRKQCAAHQHEIYEADSDLLSHSDMSWGSLKERYVLQENLSDDAMSSASSSSTSTSSSFSLFDDTSVLENQSRRNCLYDNGWGNYALDDNLWNDINAPVVQMRYLKEVLFDDYEFCGFLTDRLIGIGSSFLAKSPENGLYVLNKCILRHMSLTNITLLYYHRYLRYIDLAYNYISDVSPLGGVSYLMYLNLSHNRIQNPLNFTPPWYLTHVNFSYNYISEMEDFSSFWSIVRLDLSHNAIEVISGLEKLKYLKYLNLSYNLIECIQNLDKLNIIELNLEGNCITRFKSSISGYGINTLPHLHTIYLGFNRLSTLEFFQNAYSIRVVDLKYNRINDLLEVSNITGFIDEIDLTGNSCTKWPNYKGVLLFSLPSIKCIDGCEVSSTEKVTASTMFVSPLNVTTARTVTKLTLLEQLSTPKIDTYVKPYDEVCPPLIILTGPSAVKKISLALHIEATFPKRLKYCQWYTTKELEDTEAERQSYISVDREKFNDMIRSGDILAVQELLGHSYGFHQNEIVSLITQKKIGITQMDLHATLQMSKRYPNIKPILVLTNSEEVHRTWIRDKFDVCTWIKDSVGNLLAVTVGKHTDETLSESSSSKINFIEEILDDVIENLELPSYGIYVRPQGTATATDIILQSKMLLPKVTITRSQMEVEQKKRITFREEDIAKSNLKPYRSMSEQNDTMNGLRVILDEHSNIIVEDEEWKRKRQQAKILYRRSTLEVKGALQYLDTDEFSESESSEETLIDPLPKGFEHIKSPEYLKDMYTELVIKSRQMYLEHHMNNSGFFSLILMMDDYIKAFNSLVNFIYNLYTNHSSQKAKFLPEIEHFVQVAVPAMTDKIVEEITQSLSTSVIQRKSLMRMYGISLWKDLMPSQLE